MKRAATVLIALILLLTAGGVILKLTVPLRYAEADLRADALKHLGLIQKMESLSAVEAAQTYWYFGTDYQGAPPSRIRVTESILKRDEVRVTLHDPSARDDSIFEIRSRIYLRRNAGNRWTPYRHEWAHKGRGRIGWTTKATN